MKVQIPWAHLEDSDLVPLGGTRESIFVVVVVIVFTGVPDD